MQTKAFVRWFTEQSRRTKAQLRSKKGRAMKTGRAWVLLCGVLALILVGASLGIRIMHIIMQGTSASAAQHQNPQDSRTLDAGSDLTAQKIRANKMLLTGAAEKPYSTPSKFSAKQPDVKQKGEQPAFKGLWQQRDFSNAINQSDSKATVAGATSQPRSAKQAVLGSNTTDSSGYASQGSQATQHALADRLADSSSKPALPAQQDNLVSKAVNKLLPGSVVSRLGGGEGATAKGRAGGQAPSHKDAHYGGVQDRDRQKKTASPGLTSKATKMPNWTSFLNDNGTTSQLPLPVQNKSSASSHNLGVSALPQSGSALTQTQNSPSSSSSSAQRVEASAGSQQAAKATPADPTQSQANIMLSQAGLPKHTADMQGSDLPQELGLVQVSPAMEDGATQPRQAQTNSSMSLGSSGGSTETTLSGTDLSRTELGQSQAGLSQSLGLPEDVVQSSQTGVRSMSEGLPDDWDWESYLQLNPDVAAAVGNDPESAGLHWREWGELEKRPYKASVGSQLPSANPQQPSQLQGEDQANIQNEAQPASVSKAMDVTADDMPVLSGTTTSSTDEGSFGQLAADSLTQGSTAADAGGAATQQERAQVFDDSTTQQPDTSREEGQAGLRTDATDVSALNSLGSLAGAAAEIGLSDSTGAVHTGQDAINMQV